MNTLELTPEICSKCDVPTHLHGSTCGWQCASWIMYPENQQQNEWSRKWIDAHPGAYPSRRSVATASK